MKISSGKYGGMWFRSDALVGIEFDGCRSIVEAGQSRVLKLLKEREVELHRVCLLLLIYVRMQGLIYSSLCSLQTR